MNSFAIQHIRRDGSSAPGVAVETRDSIDFVIDGSSLLDALVKSGGGHGDFMGCFVRGFAADNERKKKQLTCADKPDTERGRYLLYLCPECGDIGCGAYGAKIRFTDGMAQWYDFAYENGYEPARALPSVGPFSFARLDYEATVKAATEV